MGLPRVARRARVAAAVDMAAAEERDDLAVVEAHPVEDLVVARVGLGRRLRG